MADIPEEHLTEELLDRLLHSAKIETYLDEEHITDRALPDYLNELLDRSGIKRNPLAEKTGMNQTFIYDIFAGKSRPGRNNAIRLAFGLGCDLRETQRLLRGRRQLPPRTSPSAPRYPRPSDTVHRR